MEHSKDPRNESLHSLRTTISQAEERRRMQRLEFNFQQLLAKRSQILENDECIAHLVEYLLYRSEVDRELLRRLLIALGEAAQSEELRLRERALMVLSQAGEHYYVRDDSSAIFLVLHSLTGWLQAEREVPAGSVVVLKRIEELTGWLLEKELWQEAEKVIVLLHAIRLGQLEKSPALRSLAGLALNRLADHGAMLRLADGYLAADAQQPLFKRILLMFGQRACDLLLHRLLASASRRERFALLQLLPAYGKTLLPTVEEFLLTERPWTMLRNILLVLGEAADDQGYELIARHLCHEDLRVQHEAVSSIVKLSGKQLGERLLHALECVAEELKPQVLQLLCENGLDQRTIVNATLQLLGRRAGFGSGNRERIIGGGIAVLKAFPSIAGVEMLRELDYEYRRSSGELTLQVEEALRYVQPQLRHRRQRAVRRPDQVAFDEDPQSRQNAMVALHGVEEEVRRLLQKGDIDKATSHLLEQAQAAVQARNYPLAERLRDRLLQINPMALDQAVELGEQIEREKHGGHGETTLEPWPELQAALTVAERKALVAILHPEEVPRGELVVGAGENDHVLYFLENGTINLHCRSCGNDNFLKRVGPGAVLGTDQFFSPSVWTVTLVAATDVRLQVLDGNEFFALAESHLLLEDKLQLFCESFANIPELLKMSGEERREYPRFPAPLFTRNTLIDPWGNRGRRSFRGELLDISRSGLSFAIRLSSRSNGKLLLGRRIQCEVEENENAAMITCSGVIVGVRHRDPAAQDATIHVKLAETIDRDCFERILACRGKRQFSPEDRQGGHGDVA